MSCVWLCGKEDESVAAKNLWNFVVAFDVTVVAVVVVVVAAAYFSYSCEDFCRRFSL